MNLFVQRSVLIAELILRGSYRTGRFGFWFSLGLLRKGWFCDQPFLCQHWFLSFHDSVTHNFQDNIDTAFQVYFSVVSGR
jgi:hypothetical protein